MERAYAELYIRTDLDVMQVASAIAPAVNGTKTGAVVVAGGFEVEVRTNPNVNDRAADSSSDDFLFFPLMAEVEALQPGAFDEDFVQGVAAAMLAVAATGASVVVACDFEDRLPGDGRL